jgi:hypothetical protein
MSTTIAHRLARVETDRFTEAVREFRPWFLAHLRDPERQRRRREALVAAGAPVDGTRAEMYAWFGTRPTTPEREAICGAVRPLMEHPDDHAAIRAALARVAPHIGRDPHDPPLTILAALRAGFASKGA